MEQNLNNENNNGSTAAAISQPETSPSKDAHQGSLIGIKFRREGKTYTFLSAGHEMKIDDLVLVDTDNGPAVGRVVTEIFSLGPEKAPPNLKAVVRIASDEDLKTIAANKKLQQESAVYFKERARQRNLAMKLVEVEYVFDRSKLIFYFSSDSRIDFRELVKDLVQKCRTKIELRQIGARQEARITRGMGICGREICCTVMQRQSERVSIKMAKEQNMSLNPDKISGICGRLMCCLAYEYDTYCDLKRNTPKCNKMVDTPQGRGKIIRQNVLLEEAVIQLEDGKEITLPFKELELTRLKAEG